MASEYPDISLLEGVVAPKVLEALAASSEQLSKARIRHALAGGLAVGAWGYPRASKDVDFLVGDEAFVVHEGGFVTFAEGVPIAFGSVPVDSLSATPDETFLSEALENPVVSHGFPILPIEALVYMKLKSPREKDRVDVVELVKAGIDTSLVRGWLEEHAPDVAKKFRKAVRQAKSEEE